MRLEKNGHYKFRVAYCKYVETLWTAFSIDYSKNLIQSLVPLMSDKVPNVKLSAGKTALRVVLAGNKQISQVNSSMTSQTLKELLRVSLQKMSTDQDRGVVTFAKESLKQFEQIYP